MRLGSLALAVGALGLTHCGSEFPLPDDENLSAAEVALTNSPMDVTCLRLTVLGSSRTEVRRFRLTAGQQAVFRVNGLPVGNAMFSADAFPVACTQPLEGVRATWYGEAIAATLNAGEVTHVALASRR
jgi:hypothetical protein